MSTENKLQSIFNRQRELIDKYQELEGIPPFPFNLDDREAQICLKDFLWRTAEELAESLEAEEQDEFAAQVEELSDALHFLVETVILAGAEKFIFQRTLEQWVQVAQVGAPGKILFLYVDCFKWLGLVGNSLKNKKWKKTFVPTDKDRFHHALVESWAALVTLFVAVGLSAEDIHTAYINKSEINKLRQKTGY